MADAAHDAEHLAFRRTVRRRRRTRGCSPTESERTPRSASSSRRRVDPDARRRELSPRRAARARLRRRHLEQAGDPLGRASALRPALRRQWRDSGTSSTRSTSRHASTSIPAMWAPALCAPASTSSGAARDRRPRVHRGLRRRLARGRRRPGQGGLLAPALDRARGADWLEAVAPLAGLSPSVGPGGEQETNFGGRNRPIRWLYLATRESYWRVMSVEQQAADEDKTSAPLFPVSTSSRSPAASIPNCGACEPECPVEAIFPEDALPEKWEPFVRINSAFNEGMDVVNELADAYATEHDVQNAPLDRAERAQRPDVYAQGRVSPGSGEAPIFDHDEPAAAVVELVRRPAAASPSARAACSPSATRRRGACCRSFHRHGRTAALRRTTACVTRISVPRLARGHLDLAVELPHALLDRLERAPAALGLGVVADHDDAAPSSRAGERDVDARRRAAADRLVDQLADDRVERDLRRLAELVGGVEVEVTSIRCSRARDWSASARAPGRSPGRAARPARARTRGRAARGSSSALARARVPMISCASSSRRSRSSRATPSSISAIPGELLHRPVVEEEGEPPALVLLGRDQPVEPLASAIRLNR